jgi:hypothetical protein
MMTALREQASAIYNCWINGNESTAATMLHQVPHDRTAYVVLMMTVLALHEGKQYPFSQFIARATR